MAVPFSSYLLFPFLLYLRFTSSAFSDQLSSSFASAQIKFWSENVNNKMPAAISSKLSPLTKQDSEYYSKAISQNNFKADTKFCSLAKLACFTSIDEFKKHNTPNQAKVYGEFKKGIPNQAKVNGEFKKASPGQAKVYDEFKKTIPNQAKVYNEFKKGAIPNQAKVYDEFKKATPGQAQVHDEFKKTIPNQAKVYDELKRATPNQAKVYDEFKKATPDQAKVYDEFKKATPDQVKVYDEFKKTILNQARVYDEFKKGTTPNQAKVYDEFKKGTTPNQAKLYDEFETGITPNEAGVHAAEIPIEKVDPFLFFRQKILKEGYTIHLSNLKEFLPFRTFLPPEIASKISLTQKVITDIFPESFKEAIDTTLSHCDATAIMGEFKACPKSLEEMISFSKTALGTSKLLALTSKSTAGSGKELMVQKIKQFNVEKIVACHEIFLPFATYFCHSLPSSRIYSVDLVEPKTRALVNTAVAICHMDTSRWPENHVVFKILKLGPRQSEACHWMDEIDLAWIAGGKNI